MCDASNVKTVVFAATAAGIGYVIGKKMAAAKGPAGFGERVGQEAAKVKSVSPAEAKQLIASKSPTIIDVRDSGDTDNGIKGAVNIPLSNLVFAGDQNFELPGDVKVKGEVKVPKGTKFCHEALKGDKNKPILVSCGLGGQAAIGGGTLADYGFTDVSVVGGGNLAWMDADGETCPCATQVTPSAGFKVCVVGGAGGIGQPLSLLMASNPMVKELAIIDLNVAMVPAEGVQADLSHIEGKCKVTSTVLVLNQDKAIDKASAALTGCDLVLVPAGVPRKPGQDRKDLLNINCDIAKGTVEACAKYCPNAVLGLIVNPVNSVVPAMCELWKKAGLDPRKIVGITTLDIVRANKFVQEKTGTPASIPVIGGHAGKTILPLFSQDPAGKSISSAEIPDLDVRVQDAGTEVVKAKNGKGSATLSMAYSGARLARAVLSGLAGSPVTECAYVQSDVVAGLPYFASKVTFGKNGAETVHPIGILSAHEQKRLEELKPILKGEIDDGLEYAKTREFLK